MKSRIMYIECKAGALTGDAHIGRVTFNKTGEFVLMSDCFLQSNLVFFCHIFMRQQR